MTQFLTVQRGIKNISIGQLDEFLEWRANQSVGDIDAFAADRAVADMYRAVDLRALGVASMPFRIESESGDVLTTSAKYEDVTGFLPKPKALLKLAEYSRTLTGTFYFFQSRNRIATLGLRYLAPQTIKPKITEAGLQYFERRINGQQIKIPVEDIVYNWMLDAGVELGPPRRFPAQAAMAAAGIALNLDLFVETFFKRGAIKATIFTLEGNPPKTELERMESWAKSWLTGIVNAFETKFFPVGKVNPMVIGEGVKELENQDLEAAQSRKIAMAMGIPMAIFNSESSSGLGGGGVASQDAINFLKQTLIPECDEIAETLNDQVFLPRGFKWVWEYENLDELHDDEAALADTMGKYLATYQQCASYEEWQAFANMTGVEYDEAEIKKAFAAKEQRAQETQAQMQAQAQQQTEPSNYPVSKPQPPQLTAGDNTEKSIERKQYLRWASKPANRDKVFEFRHLDEAEQEALGVKKNNPVKSVDAVARQFCARWTDRIRAAFEDDSAALDSDLLQILEYHIGAAYFEGLQEGGVDPQDFTADDSAAADDLIAEQFSHLPDFVNAVLDAVENIDARAGILSRAELWCNTVRQIGENARNAALDGMFEFVLSGEPSDESCETCQKLLGKKHRWSWIEARGLQVQAGNDNFECGCYRCPHAWEPVRR